MVRIAIAGAAGRMGRMLIEAVHHASDAQLVGALEVSTHPLLGRDAGESQGIATSIALSDQTDDVLKHAEVLIDFTQPQACMAHLQACERLGVKMVIGTTGLSEHDKDRISQAAAQIAIVFAPNMSVGVNVTLKLLEIAASLLNQDYDIEVIEAHHRHKVDAPSGTALAMGDVIAKTLGRDLKSDGVFARHGLHGSAQTNKYWFLDDSSWRYCWRSYGYVCGYRRTCRDHSPLKQSSQLCTGQFACLPISASKTKRFV